MHDKGRINKLKIDKGIKDPLIQRIQASNLAQTKGFKKITFDFVRITAK